MSSKWLCNVGDKYTYSTRPAGSGSTYLLLQPYFDGKNVSDDAQCTWHIELSNEPDHIVSIKKDSTDTIKVDISAAGALVDIRNTGGWPFYAWTDY
jgi:hypothetical protein